MFIIICPSEGSEESLFYPAMYRFFGRRLSQNDICISFNSLNYKRIKIPNSRCIFNTWTVYSIVWNASASTLNYYKLGQADGSTGLIAETSVEAWRLGADKTLTKWFNGLMLRSLSTIKPSRIQIEPVLRTI
ncbi:MAG: hypothetical protein IEMM0008_0340 [bacterium]|nr:MAG: hypothetical protein IEMM0008_0340 [bacterium]